MRMQEERIDRPINPSGLQAAFPGAVPPGLLAAPYLGASPKQGRPRLQAGVAAVPFSRS